MTSPPALRAGLLDLAAGIGLAGPALMLLYSGPDRAPVITATVGTLLLAAVALWVAWRRSGQRSRAAAISFIVVATATVALGDGALYYGIIWVAFLVIGVTFASRVPLWSFAAALVIFVVTLHLSAGTPAMQIFTEAVTTAAFGGIAAAVSGVLRDSLNIGDALAVALRERDAAHAALQERMASDQDLVLAQERERTARDLHDDLGHRLTAIGFSLDYAARVDDQEAALAEITHARELVGGSLDAVRRIVRAMHPVELAALQSVASFADIGEAFHGTGIEVNVTISGDADLPGSHSLLLLRFVQEGLTNVLKHADSPTADLEIRARGAEVVAIMENPKRGDAASADGFGLRSLRARAEGLDGTLKTSEEASVFRVSMTLPLPTQNGSPV